VLSNSNIYQRDPPPPVFTSLFRQIIESYPVHGLIAYNRAKMLVDERLFFHDKRKKTLPADFVFEEGY